MFGLSFLNAGLLIFAAATVLPLIIWLLAKRKPRRLEFSSLRFIRLSKEQEKKRSKLKNLILLIIRMLIILLVVLAVSRPSLRFGALRKSGKHPPTALAILVDTSYSMDYLEGRTSILDRAKQIIKQINRLSTQDDRLILITSDEDFNALHAQIYAGEIPTDLVDQISITHQPLKPDQIFALAYRKLAEAQSPNKEILLLTDLQAADYPAKPEIPVQIINPVPKTNFENLALDQVRPLAQLVNRKRGQELEFRLTNYGDSPREEALVSVVVNGIKLAERFVTVPARQSVTQTIVVELQTDGWQSGYIEVLDERLTPDNRYWFSFPFFLNPRIALVSDDTGPVPALQSLLGVYAGSGGSITRLNPTNLNLSSLNSYNLIVLGSINSLSSRLREVLGEAEAKGPGLIFVPGKSIPADYKAWLNNKFSIRLTEYKTAQKSIDFVNRHHYISTLVAEQNPRMAPIKDYYGAVYASGANPILSASGEPLMLASGRSVLWLFDPASTSNRWLLDAAFPVLAMRSIEFTGTTNPTSSSISMDDAIQAEAISLPDGKLLELPSFSYRPATPGIYIKHGAKDEAVAVNPDFAEANYQEQDLSKLKNYKVLDENWQEEIFSSRLGFELWKYLLIAALLLMLLEIILIKLEEARPGNTKEE